MAAATGGLDAVLVLGMHRSGTSAATGALARLGLHLGERLVPAADDNPAGYFEHADAVAANEDLLDALDRSWDDVRALPPGWLHSPAADAARARIRDETLAGLAPHAPWALKDPRLCRLLPLWRPLLEAAGVRAGALFVLRHPDEVAASLQARDRLPAALAHLLWLRHVLEAAEGSAGMPRATLTYARLVEDPARALGEAAARLGLALAVDAHALAGFVRADARHHAVAEAAARDPWHALALEAYAALAADEPAWSQLDAVRVRLEAQLAQDGTWVELAGATLRAADVRRRALAAQAVATEARLHQALDAVTAQSLERLATMQTLRGELDETQRALARVEALSLERLAEMERLDRELGEARVRIQETSAALAAMEARTQLAEARLARIESTWWWKTAQRVRRLWRRGG
ncbi:hypothetical protein [Vulcaniibacterium gelatinicum]|uniref:hypothetical protein n=1 Tax=Vulcaniibacterium gelatinicum TaxID=2598725 RepID=UPI0011CCB142|nr:hypothetical protein [Vulcaniibacterium gelatinicum]